MSSSCDPVDGDHRDDCPVDASAVAQGCDCPGGKHHRDDCPAMSAASALAQRSTAVLHQQAEERQSEDVAHSAGERQRCPGGKLKNGKLKMVLTASTWKDGAISEVVTVTNRERGWSNPISKHKLTGTEHVPAATFVTARPRVSLRPRVRSFGRAARRPAGHRCRPRARSPGSSDDGPSADDHELYLARPRRARRRSRAPP